MQANLEWFRTFKAIYETGTLSGAAKQLFVSQPGVGLHLNSLEAYTGYALFERTARKMIPTERGHLLYQQMLQSINALEDIENRFRKKSGQDRPTVSVGMCVETFQQALEKHIPKMDFNLIMQFGESDKLIDSLENGAIDWVLSSQKRNTPNLEFTPFNTEQLVIVAGKNTDLSLWKLIPKNNKQAMLDWFHNQIWYNTAADMKLLNQFWNANFGCQPEFVPNFIVPNKYSIIRCLAIGKGLAVLPDFLCKEALQNNEVHLLWKGYNEVKNTLYFAKRKNSINLEQISRIEKILIDEFI